jgi:hypothetical protein
MKTKENKIIHVAVTGLALVMSLVVGSNSEARERHDRRQTRQNVRVHQGAQNDQLTAGERHRLQQSNRAIRRTEERFENNDGEIGKKEAIVLEQMQDARSKQIHRLKHNDKTKVDRDANAPVEPQPSVPADDSSAVQ